MLKRARYFHVPMLGVLTHGFSAEIAPAADSYALEGGLCLFRNTICNTKDQYSREGARVELALKTWEEIRIVDLPKRLAELEFKCTTGVDLKKVKDKKIVQHYHNQWAWTYKYFL